MVEFINYLIYCVALVFSKAFGGNTTGNIRDEFVGIMCVFIPLIIAFVITVIIASIRKKKNQKQNDYIQNKNEISDRNLINK